MDIWISTITWLLGKLSADMLCLTAPELLLNGQCGEIVFSIPLCVFLQRKENIKHISIPDY